MDVALTVAMKNAKRLKFSVNRKRIGFSGLSLAIFVCVFVSSLGAVKSPAFANVSLHGELAPGIHSPGDLPLKIAEGESLSSGVTTSAVRTFKDGRISKSVLWNQRVLSDSKKLHSHFDTKVFSFLTSFYFNYGNKSPPLTVLQ